MQAEAGTPLSDQSDPSPGPGPAGRSPAGRSPVGRSPVGGSAAGSGAAGRGTAAATGRRRLLRVWAGVALTAYTLDQVTKWWAQHSLTVGVPRSVLGDLLRLDLTHNAGAAFSVGTGYTVLLTGLALVVVVVCIRLAGRLGSIGWAVALGLLLGGALGNVTDRLLRSPAPLRGHVVDFLELPHWPVFNLADASICVAAVIVMVLSVRGVHFDGTRDGTRDGARDDEVSP